jgi:hypothetical protein
MKIIITDLTTSYVNPKMEEVKYNKLTLHKIIDNALSKGYMVCTSVLNDEVNVIITR